MTTFLLDANVLIALVVEEHEHHERVARWATGAESLALCPIVEGALVRFLVRHGHDASTAVEVLRIMHRDPRVGSWPADLSYVDVDLTAVSGHRQVTDAYLVGLVAARVDAKLATLDRGLASTWPELAQLVAPSA